MKKLMILGASVLQLPAIVKAQEMGLQVLAVDINKNAVGFKEADICLEISTIDIPNVIKAAKKYRIDGVMTLASDMPVRTVAAVVKEMGIIGIDEETALRATNKGLMRDCLKKHSIPIPAFYRVNTIDEYVNTVDKFPTGCIVKPADNSGSRGVFLIKDIKDKSLIKYVFEYSKKYSRSGEILVEEYMEGSEVSVETLSVDREVRVIAITDKLTTGAPRFVEMGHSQPSQLSKEIRKKVEAVATGAVQAIGIENGPSHTEILITKDGPKIVELGARLGGDNITSHLVPLSTGIDIVKCCINIALGIKPDITPKISKGSAIRYFEHKPGRLINISNLDEAKNISGVECILFTKEIGDTVTDINNSNDRIGYVIAQGDTSQDAIEICRLAMNAVNIEVETM